MLEFKGVLDDHIPTLTLTGIGALEAIASLLEEPPLQSDILIVALQLQNSGVLR